MSPERLCRGLGFIHADLLDRHLQLSHQQVRSLILRAHAITRDPALGLACGARQTPVSWGLLGLAMPDLRNLWGGHRIWSGPARGWWSHAAQRVWGAGA